MKKRRWLAVLSAVALTVTTVLMPGAGTVHATEAEKLTVESKIADVSATVGEEISIPITFSSETELRGVTGKLNDADGTLYNSDILQYVGADSSVGGTISTAGGNFGLFTTSTFKSGTVNLKFKVLKCSKDPVTVQVKDLYYATASAQSDTTDLTANVTIAHTNVETETKEATCLTAGYTKETCKDCGALVSEKELPALGHDEGTWVTVKDSTFTETGTMERRCTRDDAVLETKEIPVKTVTASIADVSGAKAGDTITVPITFESETELRGAVGVLKGNYDETVLEYTGATNSMGATMSTAGGNFGFFTTSTFRSGTINLQFKVLKCSKDPVTVKVSGLYFATASAESEPADLTSNIETAHGETTDEIIPATCTAEGKTAKICKDCGAVVSETSVPALGHDVGTWVMASDSTFTKPGVMERRCTRDGFVLETKEIPVKTVSVTTANVADAKVGDTITIPVTVESEAALRGVVGKVKGNYDESILEYAGAAGSVEGQMSTAGGNFGFMSTTAFTKAVINLQFKVLKCTKDPVTVKITNISASLGTANGDSVPVDLTASVTIAHNDIQTEVTEATCTTAGKSADICKTCGTIISEKELPALGHDEGAWATVVKPTLTAKGKAELRCTRDHEVLDTRELPLLCDVNQDDALTLTDLVQLLDLITAGGELSAEQYDFNGDGEVTMTDVVGFLDYLTGKF